MRSRFREAYSVDDVLLEPTISSVESRNDISTEQGLVTARTAINLAVPVFSAPMDTVTGVQLATELIKLGGCPVLPRYRKVSEIAQDVKTIMAGLPGFGPLVRDRLWVSVGVQTSAPDMLELVRLGQPICVDVAHGGNDTVVETVKVLKAMGAKGIMAGNIATPIEAKALLDAGADVLRVGIGSGAYCTTRIQTGCGLPTFQSIVDICSAYPQAIVIADGGIKNSGDIVKLLAAGAHSVMLGSLLAATYESAAPYQGDKNYGFKMARGMASADAKRDSGLQVRHVEGEAGRLAITGSVKEVIDRLMQGVRSGMSYCGAHNLRELRENACFRVVTANGHRESGPHGVR